MPHYNSVVAAISGRQASSQGLVNGQRQVTCRVDYWRMVMTSRNTTGINQTTRCATIYKPPSGFSGWT